MLTQFQTQPVVWKFLVDTDEVTKNGKAKKRMVITRKLLLSGYYHGFLSQYKITLTYRSKQGRYTVHKWDAPEAPMIAGLIRSPEPPKPPRWKRIEGFDSEGFLEWLSGMVHAPKMLKALLELTQPEWLKEVEDLPLPLPTAAAA